MAGWIAFLAAISATPGSARAQDGVIHDGVIYVTRRSDRPARKNFGPDAKPARNRSQRFKPEGGKKSFKERFTGQIFGPDNEDEAQDIEIDDFATGAEEEEGGEEEK